VKKVGKYNPVTRIWKLKWEKDHPLPKITSVIKQYDGTRWYVNLVDHAKRDVHLYKLRKVA
jgi:hypothetical protein